MTNLYQMYFITTYILYLKLVKKALQNIFSLWTHCCPIIKLCIPCYNNITWYLLLIFFLILQILKLKFLFLYNSYRIEVYNKCYKITFLPPYLNHEEFYVVFKIWHMGIFCQFWRSIYTFQNWSMYFKNIWRIS